MRLLLLLLLFSKLGEDRPVVLLRQQKACTQQKRNLYVVEEPREVFLV